MGVNPDQFQPVMIIPFSLPAMGWSWDPILDTYTKEIPITLFLEKVPSNIQGILRLTWNLALNVALLGSDAWLCLNNDVTKVWQSIKTKNWGPEGDSELLDQPSMEALRLRTVLL